MEPSTWEAWCKAILSKLGEKLKAENQVPVYSEVEFKCNLCGMIWSCLTNLDGKKHVALKNKCGGVWVKT